VKSYLFSLILSILFLFIAHNSEAQLLVTNYNSVSQTKYTNASVLGTDSIFIIYSPDKNGFDIEAQLQASHNSGQTLDYTWYRFNASTKNFDSVYFESAVSQSNFTTDLQGGYQVKVKNTDATIDTAFIAWLFIEDFKISDIRVINSTCTEIELRADTVFENTFVYYDLQNGEPLLFTNKATLSWVVEPDYLTTSIPNIAKPTIEPPVEPVTYTATITDDFDYTRSFSNIIDEYSTDIDDFPIIRAVEPNFKGIATSGSNGSTDARDTTVRPEAPHGVWFVNDTKNGEQFQWYFYNHPYWMNESADSLLETSELYEPLDSIYYKHPAPVYDPNSELEYKEGYDVKLFAWGPIYNANNDRCMDTIRKIDFVIVDTTEFPANKDLLPNVFNPNSSLDKNKTFYFLEDGLPVSVSYFSIKIYNRWGNKVYDYEDSDGSWTDGGKEGWDGNTLYGGMAKPGVYYYIILAKGWDGRDFKVPGFVHIFN
jgi:hypothetical protein